MVPLVVPAAASLVPPIMPTITIFAHSTNDNPHGDDDDDDDDDGMRPFYLRPFYLPSLLPTGSR